MGKHRADGGDGFSILGRSSRGVPDGEQNPGRNDEAAREQFNQELADRHAREHQARQDRNR
jgi:hypothetical protein